MSWLEKAWRFWKQLNHPKALLFAYDSLVVNAYFLSRIYRGAEATNKMIEIAGEIDDKWLIAHMIICAGYDCLDSGDYAEAQRLAEADLELYEEIGDVIGSTMPMIILGHVALAS